MKEFFSIFIKSKNIVVLIFSVKIIIKTILLKFKYKIYNNMKKKMISLISNSFYKKNK